MSELINLELPKHIVHLSEYPIPETSHNGFCTLGALSQGINIVSAKDPVRVFTKLYGKLLRDNFCYRESTIPVPIFSSDGAFKSQTIFGNPKFGTIVMESLVRDLDIGINLLTGVDRNEIRHLVLAHGETLELGVRIYLEGEEQPEEDNHSIIVHSYKPDIFTIHDVLNDQPMHFSIEEFMDNEFITHSDIDFRYQFDGTGMHIVSK